MAYTGPAKIITLQQGGDWNTRFALTMPQNDAPERLAALERVLQTYKDEGYVLVNKRDGFLIEGVLQKDNEGRLLPAGYRSRAAFLR